MALVAGAGFAQTPPYPPSTVIRTVTFDWSTHKRDAQGSDNWALTWADDGHQYGAWGDGGGFGGTNSDGRVSLGVARIEGDWNAYRGVNVWGGKNAANPAGVDGKSWGMISVKGVLYMWVSPGSPLKEMQREARLYRSTDHAATWEPASWAFTHEQSLTIPTICQFGKDYSGARDGFVYHYFIHPRDAASDSIQKPGAVYLARCPQERIMDRSAYEFLAGMKEGKPLWNADPSRKAPAFEDRSGVGWVLSVGYNPGLKRYILMTDHQAANRGNLGVFDAPKPWGPWTTALYLNEGTNFGNGRIEPNTFFWNMPAKWLSGREFTLVFTGSGRGKNNDSFNLLRGAFELR